MPGATSWRRALVTGASSGIGEAFARRLAARGTDLVLVARRAERLEALAKELRDVGEIEVEVLAADLSDPADLGAVAGRVAAEDRPVDLLVNNAGFGTTGAFVELPAEGEEAQVRVNVLAPVRLTHAALRAMEPRGEGAIVNVSSVAGFQPLPGSATYGASKAFVTSFTQAVAEEARGSGVRVQALCPGFTRTEFHTTNRWNTSGLPGFAWMSTEVVVEESLAGLERHRVVVITGALYKLLAACSTCAPRGLVRRVAGVVLRR